MVVESWDFLIEILIMLMDAEENSASHLVDRKAMQEDQIKQALN